MANPTYVLIQSSVLGSSQASVSFNSISSAYTDLVVKISARTDQAAQYSFITFTVNGSATTYSQRDLNASGTSAYSGTGYTDKIRFDTDAASNTTSTFGSVEFYIPNYAGSTNKSISVDEVYESNSAANNELSLKAALWATTTAISSITIAPASGAGNFVANSSFYLYGVKNA